MNEIIDIHVHFGAPENSENGCFWSKQFERTPAYWYIKITSGSLLRKLTFHDVKKKLISVVTGSRYVDKCVLLAMDRVYDHNGKPNNSETHLFVPNNFIAGLAQEYGRILFGASVHPYRPDWKEELEYCQHNGAVLCKWIPSSQQIDPSDQKCFPFYDFLAEYDLPLLLHAGPEYAIPTSDESYDEKNNPKYIRPALERGVTVIIAHCALPYFGIFDSAYADDPEEFYKLIEEAENNNWKLYGDLSALTTPTRNSYIPQLKRIVPQNRLIFGSDYPIPPSELSYKKKRNIIKWIKLTFRALSIRNPIDKNYFLIRKMGFEENVFRNGSMLFEKIIRTDKHRNR